MLSHKLLLLLYPFFIVLSACIRSDSSAGDKDEFTQKIVDRSLEYSGLDKMNQAQIEFRLRDRDYIYKMKKGRFEYTRIFIAPEGDTLIDVLSNEGLQRWTNRQLIDLSDPWRQAYTNSINGVIYYAFLPYRLNDPAVIKEYMGITDIAGKAYHKIKVTFQEEGGGEGFEDIYLFWFEKETLSLDFFAYQYFSDGGGIRFRKAVNRRVINGIAFQDHLNYKPADTANVLIDQIEVAFENDELELLSEINLENILVTYSPEID